MQQIRVRQQEDLQSVMMVLLLSPCREMTYHLRQGAKNILQQVKVTLKPPHIGRRLHTGVLIAPNGIRGNGNCAVS